MSEQSQTTADTPSETQLCKMGCGFFGSGATGGMCSKCFREFQKKEEKSQDSSPAPACVPVPKATDDKAVPESAKPTPMDIDSNPAEKVELKTEEVSKTAEKGNSATTPPKKRKKKKASYKSMMKGIMHANTPERDVEKEKEALRNVTGGGTFTKIDKI